MASPSVLFGQALEAWLNDEAREWPLDCTFVRTDTPQRDLKDVSVMLAELIIPAVPLMEFDDREDLRSDFAAELWFRERYDKPGSVPQDWIDERKELVETVARQMAGLQLEVNGVLIDWQSSETDPLVDPFDLIDRGQFTAGIRPIFREVRELPAG